MVSDASYCFLPWLRTGLAAAISGPGGGPRATAPVTVAIDAAGDRREVTAPLALYGPGEVAGIDPRVVIRQAPKPGEADAEPNNFAMVELDQADFAWRHTPAGADGESRLTPWLTLAVLTAGEILEEAPGGPEGRLPAVTIDSAASLPRLDQVWAWAHVQVDGFDPATEQIADVVHNQPRRVRARLLAPRLLAPRTAYTALLVPTFERGRRAGLRETVTEDVAGTLPAWAPDATRVRLPVYFRWSFATGEEGDFEALAQRLVARTVDDSIGQRDLDVSAPDPALPAAASHPLAMEGALLSPAAAPGPWPPGERAVFVDALAALLNLPADALGDEHAERVVSPPLWGRWHAAADRLDPAAGAPPEWFNELNADPRLRATAGLGAEVVRRNDQQLMAAAWDQVEGVIAANEALKRAQVAREAAAKLHANHFAKLDLDTFMQVASPLHPRFTASSATVHETLRASPIPDGALDGQLRRVRRPAGPLARRQARIRAADPPVPGPAGAGHPTDTSPAPGPKEWLSRLNSGELRARPPVPTPTDLLVPGRLVPPHMLAPGSQPVADEGRRRERVLTGELSRVEAAHIEPPVDWRPGVAGGLLDQTGSKFHRPVPIGGDPRTDPESAAAVTRFKVAFEDLIGEVNEPPAAGPELVPADLATMGETMLAKMDPRLTVPHGITGRLRIGSWVPRTGEDPLEPVMVTPEIDQPMYEALREVGQDWLLPGAGTIPPDTVTMVVANQRFVEAYMAGLSHEMARELLYHEYPTDQRGTCFKQFWDSRGHLSEDGGAVEPTKLRDITAIHHWHAEQPLGANTGRTPAPRDGNVVLLVKGELLRRYPNAITSAIKAATTVDGHRVLGATELFPIYEGRLEPDMTFFGFDLMPDEARGTDTGTNQGWFFVLAEHPSEPNFGLDADDGHYAAKPTAWSNLNQAHFAASAQDLAALAYLDLDADLPDTSAVIQGTGEPPLAWHARHGLGPTGANASDIAWITLQRPFRVAIHGVDMLPPVPH